MLAWKWPFVRMCGIIGKKRLRKTTNKRVCVLMEKKRIQRANTSKQKRKKTKERTFAYPTVLHRKNNGWLFVVIQLASKWHARYQLRALYKINRVLLLLQFLCDIWIFIDYTVVGRALVELASWCIHFGTAWIKCAVDFVDASSGHERYKSYVNYASYRESLANTIRFASRFGFMHFHHIYFTFLGISFLFVSCCIYFFLFWRVKRVH